MIPHLTYAIKNWIWKVGNIVIDEKNKIKPEIIFIEVGGTVGDYESTQYFETIR